MSLPSKGKLLALDIGTKRTGLSISDEDQSVAFTRPELSHSTEQELLTSLQSFVEDEAIKGVIVGLPLNLEGKETEQTSKTKSTIKKLESFLSIPIISMDERLTTKQAKQKQEKPEHYVDSLAAQILLETYFSSRMDIPGSDLP